MKKNKNIVIDGNSIFMRYFFALDEYTNADGILLHGFIGFCRYILYTLKTYKPASILVTFDKCYNNFRKSIDTQYKSNRPKLDNSVIKQINLTIDFLKHCNLLYEFHSDYESDDLIASYVSQNDQKEFIIVTTDKDLYQLINERISVFNPFKKTLMNNEYVKKKYGIEAKDFAIFLALQGDSSDCIKGIKGVGPKTAAKIIQKTTNKNEMSFLFPKFDFQNLETQIQLVKLIKNIKLQNHIPKEININKDAAFQFLSDLSLDKETQLIDLLYKI